MASAWNNTRKAILFLEPETFFDWIFYISRFLSLFRGSFEFSSSFSNIFLQI